MKKTILLMFGLFTLVACSDEVVSETADVKQDESIMPPTSDPAISYESPFNDFYASEVVTYKISNMLPEDVEIIGHFGFAYFDGFDDNFHHSFDLYSIFFPNLYWNNSIEYLNTVSSTTVIAPASKNLSLVQGRCPTAPPTASAPITFNIDSASGSGNGTIHEAHFLRNVGKMYFLDVNIPSIGYSTRIKVKFGDDTMDFASLSSISSNWNMVGNINGINGDLVYNINTYELCLANNAMGNGLLSEDSFIYGGTPWYIRAFTGQGEIVIEINN